MLTIKPMNRREELINIIGDNVLLLPVVDDVIYLEEQLKELRCKGFVKVNPNNPQQSKPDKDALRQYKDFSQLYDNKLRLIARITDAGESEEQSPLRRWAELYVNTEKNNMDA